jgi:hypothetical protein
VAAVHHTFTHKQYTEYREWNIHNNKMKKKYWEVRIVPGFARYALAFSDVRRLFFRGRFTPGIFFGGGVQKIQLRTEGRENGDLGAVAL